MTPPRTWSPSTQAPTSSSRPSLLRQGPRQVLHLRRRHPAPAVEGKIFTGWGFASNDGDVPVDPDMVVTGNWAVYAMYKDAPTDDSKKDDSKPADTTKKNDTKATPRRPLPRRSRRPFSQHRRYRWWRCGVRRDRPARLRRHHRAPQARLSLTQSRWHSPESD